MLRIVRQNETDEFTSYYPQWAVLCEYVRDRYQKMIRALEQQYREPMQDAHGTGVNEGRECFSFFPCSSLIPSCGSFQQDEGEENFKKGRGGKKLV